MFTVTWEDRYEMNGEQDREFRTKAEAEQFAESIREDGGWAEVSDGE